MCGISARIVLGPNGSHTPKSSLEAQLDKSLDSIAHRGPDAKGVWVSDDGRVGLGHCRLSIEDLSDAGNQPIHSKNNDVHAAINGEIYDHERIRDELAQKHRYHFKSHNDSEVAVALYTIYSTPAFLDLRGEFSLIIYDQRQGRVIAARDRFGIKPLFWTVFDEGDKRVLLFATEAKAFLGMGWKPRREKTYSWSLDGNYGSGWQTTPSPYWDANYNDNQQIETRTIEEMIEGVREKLVEAIRLRLHADVPVGIYLSGGIDSSILAGVVTQLAREKNVRLGSKKDQITCFSIKMPQAPLDEFEVAKRTADHLGVQIIKCKVDERALAEHFADSVWHCEYHHIDLGPIGKTMLSAIPRDAGFKVVLTGEGSDEHFSGYPFMAQDFLLEPDFSCPTSILTKDVERRNEMRKTAEEGFARQAAILGFSGLSCAHLPSFAPWVTAKWPGLDPRDTVIKAMPPTARENIMHHWHTLHSSLYMNTKTWLSNFLLVSLGDRTEMAHSIEARPPFLDQNLIEYVNRLPPSLKLRYTSDLDLDTDQQGPYLIEKWILREAGRPFISDEIYRRTKQPYLAPVKWPQDGPLHEMFQELCTKEAVENLGFVSWNSVEQALQKAFGPDADEGLFRLLIGVAGWIVISQRFCVEKATEAEWADIGPYDPWCDYAS